ncbi:hypothetical protein CBM2598_U10058 [Cupriavidus taiwanensis]|uniref:Uncharacterized protein n=1 Tax=Cupriavidus taiwanensis TaxID=164546 RepID=A0A7Z7JFT0_9BURK|nr:hypothetical protein CBM2597_U10291 [Cupriavidus taiwanensis]SOZ96237.1 hypothetical protein CBM2598_U10058 [Cupriavidus taiwanensis]SPC25796.1 hypothetical protein CBM2594_U10297 [Cupriavidus taiwanensis]
MYALAHSTGTSLCSATGAKTPVSDAQFRHVPNFGHSPREAQTIKKGRSETVAATQWASNVTVSGTRLARR